MSEDIILKILAQDQYSEEMKKARAAIDQMTESEKKAALAAKEHSKAQLDLGKAVVVANQGMQLAEQVLGKVEQAYNATVGEAMNYNKAIRELSQNLAIGTEETSRIVQTADDFTVSQEAVTAALQMAVKKGMKPSIETLAQMADEYNNIADPTEKAARLTEVFGRNWTALTPMLKEGGQAIRDAAASQNSALIVTQDMSDATRELEIAQDNLNDSLLAVKLTLGNGLIPELSAGINWLTGTETEVQRLEGKVRLYIRTQGENNALTQQAKKDLEAAKIAAAEYAKQVELVSHETDASDRSTRRQNEALKSANKAYMGSVEGMKAYAGAMREANASSEGYNLATAALIINTKELTKETLFRIASEGLSSDAALKMAASMGLVDQKTAENITKQRALKKAYEDGYISLDAYIRKTQELGVAIGALPDLKVITIELRTQTGGSAGQYGGEVDFNAPSPAPSHPSTTSTTTPPASPAPHGGGGHEADRMISNNFNTTINAPPGVDINDLANRVSQRIARQLRAANNSGAGRRQ